MPDQIYIGNFAKGLSTSRLPFNIDNDAFPTLYNFYSWRGRAKRKRGTSLLGQLQRQMQSVLNSTPPLSWQLGQLDLVAGAGNLITGFGLEAGSSITPGSISFTVGGNTYTEPSRPDGTLIGAPTGTGTINYSTGEITITGGGVGPLVGTFSYYPGLPVLGLEDFVSNMASAKFPLNLSFDTTYSYQINQNGDPFFYSTSYYKGTNNPVTWSNDDYAQFWSTNYQSAFWVTNNKAGFHFVTGTYTSGSGTTTITFNFKSGGINFADLIVGDVIWFNEWDTGGSTLNGSNGTVSNAADAANGNYVITFDSSKVAAGTGISQLLTNSIPGQDGIRWYDGDPTSGTGIPTGTGLGWVNFAPPLTALTVSINDQTAKKYYLVGALGILPFKDRILFFGPQIQAVGGTVVQRPMQDTVLWSWNGTPYYNALVPTTPITSEIQETFDVRSYYVDQTGFGGYLPAGIAQPIQTFINNEDVILIGFGGNGRKTRFVYTGNDLQPFLFYLINSELPSSSTFSSIPLDRGGIDMGSYGIALTTQQSSQRIDLEIPDSVFQVQNTNNGQARVNAVRDFFREWIYFSYPTGTGRENNGSWVFPSQTFMYNYRDNTWAIFRENFTHHGTFRQSSTNSWATISRKFGTWANWREPWNSGSSTSLFPSIIAGNPQGYVLIKDQGTGEGLSGTIAAITDDGNGYTKITSINHCVNSQSSQQGTNGDYLSFQGTTIGLVTRTIDADNFVVDIPFPTVANITAATNATNAVLTLSYDDPQDAPFINSFFVGQTVLINGIVGMTQLNGNTYTILAVTPTTITLNVDSTAFGVYVSGGTVTLNGYVGLGKYSRLSQPLIQTKQFPFYWEQGRQIRLGVQKYLLDSTSTGQCTLNISLSQDPDNAWNYGDVLPSINSINDALIYTQILYTCPESTNLGLTPANVNLQMPTAAGQYQIWHRVNTSLLGDSVQVGITLSDTQMRNLMYATDEIALHGIQLTLYPGPQLA